METERNSFRAERLFLLVQDLDGSIMVHKRLVILKDRLFRTLDAVITLRLHMSGLGNSSLQQLSLGLS